MDLGAKIRKGAAWTFASKLATEGLTFAVGIVLARILAPEHFGLVTTVGIVTGLAGYFAGAGMGQALVRAKHVNELHFDVVFTMQVAIGCLLLLFFIAISPLFADFFGQAVYRGLLPVSALTFLLRPFANIPTARLQREMSFRPLMIIGPIVIVVSSSTSITLALLGFGPWSLVVGGIAGSIANTVLLNAHVRKKYALAWNKEIARTLGSYGGMVAANSLIEHFSAQSLLLVLSKLDGPASVGLYNRSNSLATMPMRIIGVAPYQPVFRALASEQENLDRSRYIYFRTLTLVMTYTLPWYMLLGWLAEPGIRFLYGEKWLPAVEPLTVLAAAGLFKCLQNPSGAVIEARNRLSAEIKLNLLAWTLLLAGAWVGLHWGLTGVAWASVAATLFFSTNLVMIALRELKGKMRALARAISGPLILNGVMFATLWLAHNLLPPELSRSRPGIYVTAMACIGGIAYLIAFLFLPIQSLKAEADKWRARLRRSRDPRR